MASRILCSRCSRSKTWV